MLSKVGFILALKLRSDKTYASYKQLLKNQWNDYEKLREQQNEQLKIIINYSYNNVPYYHKLLNKLKLKPTDIAKIEDLIKLPIITKKVIRKNFHYFKPVNLKSYEYIKIATGGTTGTPFNFRISKNDEVLSSSLRYHIWGWGGYKLGDKMISLGGTSLGISKKDNIIRGFKKVFNKISGKPIKLSSFDMGPEDMNKYVYIINSYKPIFIRGYPNAIHLLAKWIDENQMYVCKPDAIFTTSEMLFPYARDKIEDIFHCEVYDHYGLNDGGVSAGECSEHSGLHICTERSIMEIIDDEGHQIEEGEGKIIATSLHNYAMPFLRYDTGDLGFIIDDVCSCGRGYKLLKKLRGRSVDIFITPEGKNIHGWFFLYIFWTYGKGIKEYQVIQEDINKIKIKLIIEDGFDNNQLHIIRQLIKDKSKDWQIYFQFVDKIERTASGKYKFIVNNLIK